MSLNHFIRFLQLRSQSVPHSTLVLWRTASLWALLLSVSAVQATPIPDRPNELPHRKPVSGTTGAGARATPDEPVPSTLPGVTPVENASPEVRRPLIRRKPITQPPLTMPQPLPAPIQPAPAPSPSISPPAQSSSLLKLLNPSA